MIICKSDARKEGGGTQNLKKFKRYNTIELLSKYNYFVINYSYDNNIIHTFTLGIFYLQ